jgi:uncharacterized protein YeeX (DUF496 family)
MKDNDSVEELCRMLEEYRDALEDKELENSSLARQLRDLKHECKVLRASDAEKLSRISLL